MTRYEFEVFTVIGLGKKSKEQLNEFGRQGWQVVATISAATGAQILLQRPLPEQA